MVDTDDDGIAVVVVHKIHRDSFLPLCGDTKILILVLVNGHFDLLPHTQVAILVGCQIGNLPQVVKLTTCGEKGIKNQAVNLTT